MTALSHRVIRLAGCASLLFAHSKAPAQDTNYLLLSQAVQTGMQNYQSILAKRNYLAASSELVINSRKEYLPNLLGSLQQAYGTVNGQFGPLGPYGIAGTSSAGPIGRQSWNAGFGALYVINSNWEVFSFGRLRSRIAYSMTLVKNDSADLVQEEFIQGVKISGAYLNLLVSQTLYKNALANLDRARQVQYAVLARTKNGLNAGVDSSFANADVSNARLVIIDATNAVQQYSNQLAQLINGPTLAYVADTSFLTTLPKVYNSSWTVEQNPQVLFYKSRVEVSNSYARLLAKSILPGVNLFGIFQSRGSGFADDYTAGSHDYTGGYWAGINPARSNYVAGLSISWNIFSAAKIKHQLLAQQSISKGLQNEYDLIDTQLKDELLLANQRIETGLQAWKEAPVQLKAAQDAYVQKSVLYKNGLTNIIDLQQALYLLNRAETDMSVAYVNVWQALLQKAAATGDFNLFLNQVK